MCPFELFFNHYNHTELLQHSLAPNRLPQGFKAELSQGDFILCSQGKSVLSTFPEQTDIEVVEEDASGLLPYPVDGCVSTYQSFRNLERPLLVGKCKMIPEKHTLLDAAKFSYVKKVKEGTGAQPTLAQKRNWCKAGLSEEPKRWCASMRTSVNTLTISLR